MQKKRSPSPKDLVSVGFLFDDTLDSNDGVAQYVKTLGAWLSQNGYRVVYLCGETKLESWAGGKVYSLASNIKVSFNGNHLSMPLWSRAAFINSALQTERPNILHIQVPYSPLMSQRVIRRGYKSAGVVGTFHIMPSGYLSDIGSRLLRLIQWRSLKKFDYLMSVSSSAQGFATKTFGIKSSIVPNMIQLSKFTQSQKSAPVDGKIVFLGRLVKRKGCAELIKAFAILSQQDPTVSLVVAGDGPERPALEKLVARLNLQAKVAFLGFIKEEDKAKLLGSAAVACFPSLYGESFGIVLLEAMASGAGVVVGGNNPGYQSVLGEKPKLLVDARNTQAFAERLKEFLRNKTLASELHDWLQKDVKKYDIEVVGPQIVRVYNQAIAKKSPTLHNKRYGIS